MSKQLGQVEQKKSKLSLLYYTLCIFNIPWLGKNKIESVGLKI